MIRQSFTSLPSLDPIFELARRCEIADGYSPKFYWNLVESRRYDPRALDYLYCASPRHPPQPIGLLSIYYFQDGVEITAVVDPDFRHQGIFSQLMQKALEVLRLYQVSSYFLICNAKASSFNERCAALGGKLHHSEIEMRGPVSLTYTPRQPVILQRATIADIALLVDLHQACFPGSSVTSMRDRLNLMLAEPHRQIWIAKDLSGNPIGKLHAREDAKAVFLHDLGIIPALWRQGYGGSLVHQWYQQYSFPENKPIMIDVLGDNEAALRLYTACGFTITSQYNFWQFVIG